MSNNACRDEPPLALFNCAEPNLPIDCWDVIHPWADADSSWWLSTDQQAQLKLANERTQTLEAAAASYTAEVSAGMREVVVV